MHILNHSTNTHCSPNPPPPPPLTQVQGCRTGCEAANFYCEIICQKWGTYDNANPGADNFTSCATGCKNSAKLACSAGCTHDDAKVCKEDVKTASSDFCAPLATVPAGTGTVSSKSACSIGVRAATLSGCKRGISLVAKA